MCMDKWEAWKRSGAEVKVFSVITNKGRRNTWGGIKKVSVGGMGVAVFLHAGEVNVLKGLQGVPRGIGTCNSLPGKPLFS